MKNISQFEICSRAVIVQNNKILVCQNKKKNYYFFPGGHIEFSETAKQALKRELKEELDVQIKHCVYIGTVENIYSEDRIKHHEINLVFKVDVRKLKSKSQERHISFYLLNLKSFKKKKIYPIVLRNAVVQYLKNKKTFWTSRNKK